MLVHSILCMFTPLPSVSQHALASSTHKGRGFLLCSGCSQNHFGDFLLQRAARLHSLSTGENGLPGSFDVCWRENKSLRCAIEGSRIELCVVEGSLVSNMCAEGKDRRLDVRWRDTWMVRCVLEGMSGQTAWRNPPAHTKNRKMGRHSRQRTFFKCSCPPAHTYSGSFSFGLREWTITKLSRPFFSIEQSR